MAKQFRNDINGLRAIAVIIVVFFHFQVPGFTGGYVGVDVFFVISGFLMTQIIVGGIDASHFSIMEFYLNRGRRIIPALLVLCISILVFGWFVLLPSEMITLSKHAASAVTFVSNFMFWKEAGYFNGDSLQNELLHTWSLSVEWQFYMLYPVVLVALRRWMRRKETAVVVLAVCAVLSYGLTCYLAPRAPTANFYLLPTRAWEMLAGGLVYLYPVYPAERTTKAMEWTGMALIGVATFFLSDASSWPGWRAAIPVGGTAIIIAARRNDSLLTANPVSNWIGRSSYSIYLWHWPVVFALAHWGLMGSWGWRSAGMALSMGLGRLSFLYVEQPALRLWQLRRDTQPTFLHRTVALAKMAAVPVFISAVCVFIWHARGVAWRFDPSVALADHEADNMNHGLTGCFASAGPPRQSCVIGGDGDHAAVELIGDSHAAAEVSALAAAVPAGQGGVLFHGYASCATIANLVSNDPENHCFEFNRRYLDPIINGPAVSTPLVVINFWSTYLSSDTNSILPNGANGLREPLSKAAYAKNLKDTLCAVSRKRPTYVTLPLPDFPDSVPMTLARKKMFDHNAPDIVQSEALFRQRHADDASILRSIAKECDIHLLDPAPYLCRNGQCMGSLAGRPLYFDRHHLSEYGNRFIIPMFRVVFGLHAQAGDAGLPVAPMSRRP